MLRIAVTVVLVASLSAQAASRFEVASIKRASPSPQGGGYAGALIGNRWLATNTTLRNLVRSVYDMWLPDQVVGGPDWIDRDPYDIVGIVTGKPTQAEQKAMAKALLAERFNLRAHVERRPLTTYEVIRQERGGGFGPRLRQVAAPGASDLMFTTTASGNQRVIGKSISAAAVINIFQIVLRQPVTDQAALAGTFDLDLEYAPLQSPPGAPGDGPSIFTAAEEQLGLKLNARKQETDVLVIDRIERPSTN